jgi:Ca2+-binding RTX toxin-like protein
MRKTILLLASVALAMIVAGGVAWAATIQCPKLAKDWCYGTEEADTIRGTGENDRISAEGGGDTIYSYGGWDRLEGGAGSDRLYGGRKADSLHPNTQQDTSNDYVHGGREGDIIHIPSVDPSNLPISTEGVDRVYGERGDDVIFASQWHWGGGDPVTKTIIDCGPGRKDRVVFDRGVDVVKENCEIKEGWLRPRF